MSDAADRRALPVRAIASVLFACCSLFLFGIYSQVHWLPTHFSRDGKEIFHHVLSEVGPIRDRLDIGYRVAAGISLAWCIWSWRTEGRVPATIATAFAALAMFCAVFVLM